MATTVQIPQESEEELTQGAGLEIPETEVEQESEEVEEDESKSADAEAAIQLYNALNNPATAAATLAFLNTKISGGVTKTELAEIYLKDILKEGFGDEYAFLHDKLSPALEKAINAAIKGQVSTSLDSIRNELNQTKQELAATRISAALDPIIEEMGSAEFDKIAPNLEKAMQKYPNQGQPLKAYIRDMIKLVSPTSSAKAQANVREARRNLSSGANPTRVKIGSKTPTIREAVLLATQGKTIESD